MANAELKEKRTYIGTVTSDLMDKTIVVRVERTYMHPEFHKTMRTTKKYKVHDEKELANVGDTVEFYEGRPVSKTKYMYLARVVSAAESNSK
jgi:small subunit ribosomal protein S17